MAKPLTYQELYNGFKTCRDGSYTLITPEPTDGTYIKTRDKVRVRHDCGHEFETKYQHFVNDSSGRCTVCYPIGQQGTFPQMTLDDFKRIILEKFNGELTYVSGFTKAREKVRVRHSCGREYEVTAKDITRPGARHGCRYCSNESRRNSKINFQIYEDINKAAANANEFTWLEPYKNNNKLLHKVRHDVCGTIFKAKPNKVMDAGYFCCPNCTSTMSYGESVIKQFLEKYDVEFKKEFTDPRCKSFFSEYPCRFDFMIQYDEDKKIVIEYDGSFHDPIKPNDVETAIERKYKTRANDAAKDYFIATHPDEFFPLIRIHHTEKDIVNALKKKLSEYYLFEDEEE